MKRYNIFRWNKCLGFIVCLGLCIFSPIRSYGFGTKLVFGEKTVSFKTRDGVNIISSFFFPTDYFREYDLSVNHILYEEGIWSELEKEFLVVASPVKKGKATRILIHEGTFSFTHEELFSAVVNNSDLIDENKEIVVDEKILLPLREKEYKIDPVDRALSPYGTSFQEFSLQHSCRVPETKKKKINRSVVSGKFHLVPSEFSSLMKNSCFYSLSGSRKEKYPAVILLHMWQRNRHEWRPLIPYFQDAGFAVLAIDLRGHGDSQFKNGKKLNLSRFVTKNYRDMVKECFEAYKYVIDQEVVDNRKISIVGASLGTVLAIKLCERINKLKSSNPVRSIVVLSPSQNFFAVKVNDSIRKCEATPILFIMDKQDPTKEKNDIFVSGSTLYNKFDGPKEALIFDGLGHGTAMFMNQPELKSAIVDWARVHSR